MGKKIRVWDGSAWQDVSVALPYNAVHSAQASMPSTAVDGQIWLDTDGTLSDTQYIPKTLTSTTGDIIYASSANTPARLGIGTSGQLLGISGGVPAWVSNTFVGCRLTNSVAQTIANSTRTSLTFDTESFDTDGFHSTSSNTSRITVPSGKAGKYLVTAAVTFTGPNATGAREVYIFKNAGFYSQVFTLGSSAGSSGTAIADIIDLAVGDYIEIRVEQASGGSLDVRGNNWGTGATYFGATYLGA